MSRTDGSAFRVATSKITAKDIARLVRRSDAGEKTADIAERTGVSAPRIYEILRQHRSTRKRSSRAITSEMRDKIVAMAKAGSKPRSIAQLLKVSRQDILQYS